MTGAPVTAIGGDFYLADGIGDVEFGDTSLILNDGTQVSLNFSPGASIPFVGFISDPGTTITSLRMRATYVSVPFPGYQPFPFNSVDNLVVGQAIPRAATAAPEPGSLALLAIAGLTAVTIVAARRQVRRRKS
jgi:hypothetical protein